MPPAVGLSEAKANLSALVRQVDATGQSIVITVRSRPVATISPYEDGGRKSAKAFGALSRHASDEARAQEEGAWARSIQERGVR